MIFNSFAFVMFIAIALPALVFLPTRIRIPGLIIASYIFYAAANPIWLIILVGCTVVDYHLAHWLDRQVDARARKLALIVSCAMNLGLLISFKYTAFIAESINVVLSDLGATSPVLPVYSPALPLGISFFVFESLSYVIDVYRRRTRPVERLSDYALFISFFPHLIAGPIVRAQDFIPRIRTSKPLQPKLTVSGIELIVWGLFKKMVVADNIGPIVDQLFEKGGGPSSAAAWSAGILFAVQIYCDFSGYTDIARGLARLFGLELCQNFRWPYFSRSIRDFWRRWHMSLSSWLRDYLYIPLGGNRNGRLQTTSALFLTWFLGGLWHGAAWHFVIWGLYHGALVAAGNLLYPRFGRAWDMLGGVLQAAFTFALVCIGWIIFRAPDMTVASAMIVKMLTPWQNPGIAGVPTVVMASLVPLAAGHFAAMLYYQNDDDRSWLWGVPYGIKLATVSISTVAIVLLSGQSGKFIYFQF